MIHQLFSVLPTNIIILNYIIDKSTLKIFIFDDFLKEVLIFIIYSGACSDLLLSKSEMGR